MDGNRMDGGGDVCAAAGLGRLLENPMPVTGGLLHRMYKFVTEQGTYAVKRLNPEIASRPGVLGQFDRSEQLAEAARSAGVRALPALGNDGRRVIEVRGQFYLIYSWIEGVTAAPGSVDRKRSAAIGCELAKLHSAGLDGQSEGEDGSGASVNTGAEADWKPINWPSYAAQGVRHGSEWSQALGSMAERLVLWDRTSHDAGSRLLHGRVIGHGDLDRKNVMWTADELPLLIDWESAGCVHPAYELLETAWYWAVDESGAVDEAAYKALIGAYLDSGGSLDREAVPDALQYGFRGRLDWLAYNVRRSLGEAADTQEQALGTREAAATLDVLVAYAGFIVTAEHLLGAMFDGNSSSGVNVEPFSTRQG